MNEIATPSGSARSEKPKLTRNGSLLVAAFVMRQICWSRRSLIVVAMMLMPAVTAVLVRWKAPMGTIDRFYTDILPNLQLGLWPLVCLFFGASLVRDAMEDHTLAYLLTRPLGRVRVIFGYYIGLLAFLLPVVWLNVLAVHATVQVGRGGGLLGTADELGLLLDYFRTANVAIPFYCALYFLIGVRFKFPSVIGIMSFSLLDLLFGFIQGPLRALSPAAYFEEILGSEFNTRAFQEEFNPEPFGPEGAFLRIFIVWVIFILLVRRFSARRDFMAVAKHQN